MKETLEERFREIDDFWDAKTTWVHRRALVLGLLLGVGLGISGLFLILLTFYS